MNICKDFLMAKIGNSSLIKFPCYVNDLSYNFELQKNQTCQFDESYVIQPNGIITYCELLDNQLILSLTENKFIDILNKPSAIESKTQFNPNCVNCKLFNSCKGGCYGLLEKECIYG